MPQASQKTVKKEAENNRPIPSYTLNVIFNPEGLQINQDPKNCTPLEVIAVLDIVKQMHLKYFSDLMQGAPAQSNLDETVKKKIAEASVKSFGKNSDGNGGTFNPGERS